MPKSEIIKKSCFFAAVSICVMLLGCGESSDYGANVKGSVSINQGQDFPACGKTNENQILYVHCKDRTSPAVYKCIYDAPFWDWYIDHTTLSVNLPCPVPGAKSSNSQRIKSSSSLTSKSSSSQEIESSSSSNVVEAANDTTEFMTDSRDGQTYRIVKIGNQVWMAENLNFKTKSSLCYNNSDEYCERYGRLYTWSEGVHSACPSGWHLPSREEFETLITAAGGSLIAGKRLKSSSDWNGMDDFGFSALPAGDRYSGGGFYDEGVFTAFWSSTGGGTTAYPMYLDSRNDKAGLFTYDTDYGFSVRCLKTLEVNEPTLEKAVSCKNAIQDNCIYGSLTDARDGHVYKTRKIGSQTWMVENLDYETQDGRSCCYNNVCNRYYDYGQSNRLYNFDAAKSVCPKGWRLPSKSDFDTLLLLTTTGGDSRPLRNLYWGEGVNKGTDIFGFNAVPVGIRGVYDYSETGGAIWNYRNEGSGTGFWSSTILQDSTAYSYMILRSGAAYTLNVGTTGIGLGASDIVNDYVSVRCIQDNGTLDAKSSSSNRSSSSNARLSSETAQSSSSGNTGFVGGTLVDSRDDRTYATVSIGSQTWMAENLNFKTDSSFCYNSSADNCEKYGRLYTWENAKSACPRGWHLPSNEEWGALFTAVGGQSIAGSKLKFSSGWNEYKGKSGNGSDSFGFSSLPAGYRNNNGNYYAEGSRANFWSSSEIFGDEAYNMCLHYDDDNADLVNYDKGYGFSVRCLKD